jgi:outer membrane protein OmpA-like peptidoglycan-associated protein
MRTVVQGVILAVLVALLGACATPKPASTDLIVLVPDGVSGKVGTVVVKSAQGESTLNQAYASARVEEGKPEPRALSQKEVNQMFSEAIAVQPPRPVSFLLYFLEGTDDYTPESKVAFEGVFAEIARRKVAEIVVIGHTDRVGKVEANDELSRKRAERVRKDFMDRGIPANAISVAGRGEREPIVRTADEVAEPTNRRVEINVR